MVAVVVGLVVEQKQTHSLFQEAVIMIMSDVKVIRTNLGTFYARREGDCLRTYNDENCTSVDNEEDDVWYKEIKIPLFYRIARYTSVRRSYKRVLLECGDRGNFGYLQRRGIIKFMSEETMRRAGSACGRHGGSCIAFLLGIFCQFYDKIPRNINVVQSACEKCTSVDKNGNFVCGGKKICGGYYGCGEGVLAPLPPGFDVSSIPRLREAIRTEEFPEP